MPRSPVARTFTLKSSRFARPQALLASVLCGLLAAATPAPGVILWSDANARTVHNTGAGVDILGGASKRTDTNNDALYFKFHVRPLSDQASEPYFAGMQLFEGDEEHLGVGNALEAWAYSAWHTSETGPSNLVAGEFNLNSSHPEPSNLGQFRPYEIVNQGVERTIVFKVQYVPGGDDLVTVWLDPHLGYNAREANQPENLTTRFRANGRFDQVRLRHGKGEKGDGGNGWVFSDMAIATSFDDFVVVPFWLTWWFISLASLGMLSGVGWTARVVEKRKLQRRLSHLEQERTLERERARIAQDLHDELGSSLTRISLLSDLTRTDRENPALVEDHARKIAQSAAQTVRALEEIVWAVRPGSDSLQSLVEYIAHFASELFDGDEAKCRLDLPPNLPDRSLPPDVRHNIFLVVKEALTNALKHAGAKEVRVAAKATDTELDVSVQDDGRGFDMAARPGDGRRNGMGNMRRRAEAMAGSLSVTSAPGQGTTVRLTVRFPEASGKS